MLNLNRVFILFLMMLIISCSNDFEEINLIIEDGSFTILVIPDTQNYFENEKNFIVYQNMFSWIEENKEDLNIKCILQTGDITKSNSPNEWSLAISEIKKLSNSIPFIACLGNHDYEGNGNPINRNSLYIDYFHNESNLLFESLDYGFFPQRKENYYQIFEFEGQKFLIMSIEWLPEDSVLEWANTVIEQHKEVECILLTHAYLKANGDRYNSDLDVKGNLKYYGPKNEKNNDGDQIWTKLIRSSPNIFLVISGHIGYPGSSFLQSRKYNQKIVNQMSFNRQYEENGGNGWIRLLEFQPDSNTIKVHTFSPFLNRMQIDNENNFIFNW